MIWSLKTNEDGHSVSDDIHDDDNNNNDDNILITKSCPGYLGLPRRSGKIKDISLFDNEFFKVNEEDAHYLDSQIRIMLEITFEALWDSGKLKLNLDHCAISI